MIELVIQYSTEKEMYMVFEPTTDTLIVSASLTEALVNISKFLSDSGMIVGSILDYGEISYHIDSATMKAMIESNVNLMKRLNSAPSGFTIASQKFGGSSGGTRKESNGKGFKRSSGSFSKSGFNETYKKFGSKR